MKNSISNDILEVVDVLERINDVNKLLELHKDDDDDLILSQYLYQKNNFIKELLDLLQRFDISPNELVKDYQKEVIEGNTLSNDELKNMVDTARQQMQAGEGLTTLEAKEKIKS